VLFRKWLIDKRIDPKSVNFVEVTFLTMNDALKSGSIDAVLTAGPFITRIKKAGNGEVVAYYLADLNRTDPIISYVSTRSFAEQHPDVIKAFRPRSKRLRRSSTPTVRRRASPFPSSPRCRSISCASTSRACRSRN
jgi:ABC-type taurine transport system substrate-binding protein